jgi:hypothetical protein
MSDDDNFASPSPQVAIERLSRGEMVPDNELTLICEAYFAATLPQIERLAEAEGMPMPAPDEISEVIRRAAELLRQSIRAGATIVEMSPDGNGFRIKRRSRH